MGMGNPHGSHDGYRAGTGTGMILLTCAHTCTHGMGLHTCYSLPPSTHDDDGTSPMPRPHPPSHVIMMTMTT